MAISDRGARPGLRTRMLLFLYSGKNILGCVLALAGLGLHFTGVIDRFWWAIVPGLYAIGALVIPRARGIELRTALDSAGIKKALDRLLGRINGKVPEDILKRVSQIADTINSIVPRIGALGSGSQDTFILQRTVTDYLPGALEPFLGLPRAYATVHPIKDGKTAKQILAGQLDLLQGEMNEISDAVNKNDTDKLLTQARFLEERFGQKDLTLGPGATTNDPG